MSNPRYVAQARIGLIRLKGGSPATLSGNGGLGNLLTAGENDSKIQNIIVQAMGETEANQILLFLKSPTTSVPAPTGSPIQQPGVTRIFAAINVPANNKMATDLSAPPFRYALADDTTNPAASMLPFDLPAGWELYVGALRVGGDSKNTFDVTCVAGDY